MRDWTGSSCRKTPPRQRARPPLYCCWCPWNRNKRITAFSPNRNPLLHTKPTYPLSVVKKISIPCCVCQESKYKIEALIHTPLVSCLYCTDCMGSICSQPGLWWQLRAFCAQKGWKPKVANPPGWGAASWWAGSRVSLAPDVLWKLYLPFRQITSTGEALPAQSIYSDECCAEADGH